MNSVGLYLHIPFCKSRCFYCDFCTYAGMEEYHIAYVDAMIKEIKIYNEQHGKIPVETVFIGGGTPTILHYSHIEKIVSAVEENFDLVKDAEFSIESNPGTLSLEQLKGIKETKINRMSIGLQAVQNELLKYMGRIHNYETFLENYDNARRIGFDNINVDLIFSLPNQSLQQWEESLKKIISLGLDHISCYSFTLEENTKFHTEFCKGKLNLIDEEIDRKMNDLAVDLLTTSGYLQYEISNFSKYNKQCKHNIIYWKNKEYLGIGVGAHGHFNKVRYSNALDIKEYIHKINSGQKSIVSTKIQKEKDEIEEFMILGFRLIEGIDKMEFKNRFKKDIYDIYGDTIEKYKNMNLIIDTKKGLKLTKQGINVSNSVLAEFLL